MENILLVETCEIECFFGFITELQSQHVEATLCKDDNELSSLLQHNQYDVIMISLEPDGKGGIQGIEELEAIINSNQSRAVCFSVSTSSAASLLSAKADYLPTLSVVAGWINLPMNPIKATKIIKEIVASPGELTISARKSS